ncbi:protein-L-isoaspartate(D-aspartate) O-methyltransferase [Nonomuraea sp. NPDC050536]|uniref:protein-L-isoaspartate(D-aspartate) O-methyltransferase n=1 Tax=Nonomuraea sp. NPDC050536 TaxID=3364366 RepID=UPI0037C74886
MRTLVEIVRQAGVTDPRLLDAVRATPRERFVPPEFAARAELDAPIPIGHDQPTSQPSLVARMIDALRLSDTDEVLEIGTGCGYMTALLARLARRVYSVERHADLAELAMANLASSGLTDVEIVVGDGSLGLPAHAPFDAIIVSATASEVPAPLVEQLKDGGRLVMPIHERAADMVTLFAKRHGRLQEQRLLLPACFVPLVRSPPDPYSNGGRTGPCG